VLLRAVASLPEKRTCECANALDGIKLPLELP
jgi:5'-methylthioadenosine phosphorylase